MFSQIIITFFGWLILTWTSTNLIGMIVRGLVLTSEVEKLISKGDDTFKRVVSEFYKPQEERKVNITVLVLITIYLSILFHFWNMGVVIVAILLMVVRIPDLLWEMRHKGVGKKGLLMRADLADAVISATNKQGIDTQNETKVSIYGEFVVAMTREGKVNKKERKNMPAIYMLTSLVMFLTLPVLWYVLYQI